MVATIGSSPYIYVSTRLRVRRAQLIPKEEYLRMLNMSLPEITRFIQESEYKREIDELSPAFSGIDLLEVALSWNLAKNYQKVLAITPSGLQFMTQSYLRRWDIQNVLTILRGKTQRLSIGRIKEVLIPAGELDRVFLDRLIAEPSVDRVVEGLKKWRLYPVLLKEYTQFDSSDSFAHMENELYKKFYEEVIADAMSGVRGGKAFLEYIRLDIDIKNLQNLFRLRAGKETADVKDILIPGGSVPIEDLERLNTVRDAEEFADTAKSMVKSPPLLNVLEEGRKSGAFSGAGLHEVELALTRMQLKQIEFMSKMHPFTIWPILAYLERKKFEIFNLRAITRGKESNLPTDRIKSYLVV
ncbi:MAG: V-type ATP synthase subunit C [Methanoregulaceae archaeon]|nr:V-type ATP synthase subunit C [Methanoregulaceae archaeon]